MKSPPSASDFPELFKEFFWDWGPIRGQFELLDSIPPYNLIGHVRTVPFVGDKVVVVRMSDGHWSHPGGTLEPGETYLEAAERELLEEAGAQLITFEPFGVFHCFSLRPEPYRPHLPHPEFYHVIGFAEVEIVSAPENPPGEEAIIEVECVSVEEASRRFADGEGEWLAQMYQLADLVRRNKGLKAQASA